MQTEHSIKTFTAFAGARCIGSGPIEALALQAKAQAEATPEATILFFDDQTGKEVDLNLRGSDAEVVARLAVQFAAAAVAAPAVAAPAEDAAQDPAGARGRGRPKLGVVAREVTLLPRHWDWLNSQPGSASVVLRKLIDEARHTYAERDRRQQAQSATYLFISAMAGDRACFEDASRALFAGERQRFIQCMETWPDDIRRHAGRLSAAAFGEGEPAPDLT